jgi:alkylation response protein AidB-like acyl-CoA dehydrogenase
MYRLSAAQQQIVDRAKRIADEVIGPQAERSDREGAFPRASLDALARDGFYGLTIPKAHGGMGEGLRTMCAVLDEISQRCASTGMVYKMHLCGVATYVASGDRQADLLRRTAKGEHLTTLAWSETGSRSQFWAPVSRAKRNGHGITLDADKSFVTSAGEADGYVVSTQWADAQSPLQSMLYLVLADDDGVAVQERWNGIGMRGNASSPMKLRRVSLGADRALCDEGKGIDAMLGVVLPVFMLGNAAISVGIAEAAVAATQRHLTGQRFEHTGTSLADLPNLRARLAEMRIETDRARAHLVAVLDSLESPGPLTQILVLESKAAAAEAAVKVTEIGMRACGGAAFGRRVGLERQFRDARAAIVMAPTTDHVHEFIGRALCGMELFG